jgi:hypothetical protein
MGGMGSMGGLDGRAVRAGGLSSARDRARLREREAAERARVESVLARGPREAEPRRGARAQAHAHASRACAVCGGDQILEDEVFEGGGFRLGWCRRCDHRWTERLSPRFVPRVRRPSDRTPAERQAASGA